LGHLRSGHTTSCGCVHTLAEDLTGQRFGKLTALKLTHGGKRNVPCWVCCCDCGNATTVSASHLRTGHTTTCGCIKREIESGERYGRLVTQTLSWRGEGRKQKRLWTCQCDCGGTVTVLAGHLSSGHTQSCGCLHPEVTSARNFKHGLTGTPELYAYWSAKNRCENPDHPSYRRYGGRGIKFQFASFEEFITEVGPRPSGTDKKGAALYSIDRINNDGHYENGNLRWATKSQQMKNSTAKPPLKVPYAIKNAHKNFHSSPSVE
jgi:hypothetical protein